MAVDLKALIEEYQALKAKLPTQEKVHEVGERANSLLRSVEEAERHVFAQVEAGQAPDPRFMLIAILGREVANQLSGEAIAEWASIHEKLQNLRAQIRREAESSHSTQSPSSRMTS